MFETSKLRGRIIEKFGTLSAFAREVSNSMTFISLYMNGKTQLDQKTMDEWITVLDIPNDEIDQYFFAPKVHETEQKGGE